MSIFGDLELDNLAGSDELQNLFNEIGGEENEDINKPPVTSKEEDVDENDNNNDTDEEFIEIGDPDDNEEEENDNDDEGKDKPSSTKTSSPFLHFASFLHEEGILSDFDEKNFDNTEEGLFNAIKGEIDKQVGTYKQSLPETIKTLIENYEEGVPLEELIKVKSKQIEFNKIKEDELVNDESLQEKIYAESLKKKGFSEEKIARLVKRAKLDEELLDEAKDSLAEIRNELSLEEAKIKEAELKRKEKEEEDRKNTLLKIKTDIESTDEIIPKVKLTPKMKESLYKSLTTPVKMDENGRPINAVVAKRMEDPLKFELTLHYLNQLGVFDGKWDKIVDSLKTKAVKDLKTVIDESSSFTSSSKRTLKNSSTEDDELISSLKSMFNK